MRINQIYDIDNRTYLIRFHRNEEKVVLLMESGLRIHTTNFEWPKNVSPSGFTMKMRKHLKNKRLEKIEQIGIDRIIDLQFGIDEAAYHIILELYDRGNIILTNCDHIILNVLRPHAEGEEVRFAVREAYPFHRATQDSGAPSSQQVKEKIEGARPGDNIRTVLNPLLNYGPSVIDHCLTIHGLSNVKIGGEIEDVETAPGKKKKNKKKDQLTNRDFNMDSDLEPLMVAIKEMDDLLRMAKKV